MTDHTPDLPGGNPDPVEPEIVNALSGLPEGFGHFARVFQDEIRPALQAREGDRIAAVAKARQARYVGGAVGVLGVLLGLFVAKMPFLAFVGAIVGFSFVWWGGRDLAHLGKEAKALLVTPVARQFELGFNAEPGQVDSIHKLREIGIVPAWDRDSYEDLVTGQRKGVDFELFEAHLEERRQSTDAKGRTRTHWVTVFRGQCLRFAFDKTFYGRTLVTRDAGFFNRFGGGKGMQKAALEDPEFEKIFEVYTTDQVESRFLLTPDLMQKLVDMEKAFHGGKLKCCFDEGELFITLQGSDLFEPGSMFKRLDDPERVRELLKDFAAVFNIIDAVMANRRERDQGMGA
ncbi:DUF3137 domain-containing protein [Hyphomonas johnsonii]|uniref:Galanin n=1 Tax=Hyphomonas johnsonii MHS-2 TaxID=1280950 RepID=A0A059FRG8_9PROT|nr:DUF3137 domain-containing protein [Hyphomonas johnsonii]KCZ93269.1 hypothetical protein HJO_05420 [Hyphomonas johnsonii MHS-2]